MKERALILIKPDGIERKLTGEIIARFEKSGLRITAVKMLRPSKSLAERHYPATRSQLTGMGNNTIRAFSERYGNLEKVKEKFRTINPYEIGKSLRKWMVKFLSCADVIAFVIEGENAVRRAREIAGSTDPVKAKKGTIRGDFGKDSIAIANKDGRTVRNLVHVSGNRKEAEREIKLWFKNK